MKISAFLLAVYKKRTLQFLGGIQPEQIDFKKLCMAYQMFHRIFCVENIK